MPARLKRLRTWQGYTQREVAQGTGGVCSARTLQDWETGRHLPSPGKQLRAIAEFYRVPPGWILNGEKGNPYANNGGTDRRRGGEADGLDENRD